MAVLYCYCAHEINKQKNFYCTRIIKIKVKKNENL